MHASRRSAKPLSGVGVIVTRPVGRGATTARCVLALGARVAVLPTASLRITDDPALALGGLRQAQRTSVAVFTSPSAVRFAFRLLPEMRFAARTRVVAVGPATQKALRRRGVEAIVPSQRFDTEGLLALPALRAVRGTAIALITAPGGREVLARTLLGAGARVRRVEVYRRALPRWSSRHLDALRSLPPSRLLLLSSAEALAALYALLPAPDWRALRKIRVVASSQRVADAARAAGFARASLARSALTADLLDAAVRAARVHRRTS